MMLFFNRTRLERIGVVGPKVGLLLGWSAGSGCGTAGLQSLNVALFCKDKKKKGPAAASPVAAPMPMSVFFLREKIDCLECECVAYLSLMG